MTTTPAGRVSRESVREIVNDLLVWGRKSEFIWRLDQLPDAELPDVGVSDAVVRAYLDARGIDPRTVFGQESTTLRIALSAALEAALRPSGEDRG